MAFPFPPPGQEGDDEDISEHLEAGQELQSGEQGAGDERAPDKIELPPEAQGETNGGPLGCCLGVTVGLLLSLTIAILSSLFAGPLAQVFHGYLALSVRIAMAIVALGGAVLFGSIGWKIGKRLYREYELSPKQKQRVAHLEQKYQQRQARSR